MRRKYKRELRVRKKNTHKHTKQVRLREKKSSLLQMTVRYGIKIQIIYAYSNKNERFV